MAVLTDVNLITDLSGSYRDDLPIWKSQVSTVVNRLINPNLESIFGKDIQFGLSSFVDKPVSPFGGSGDYVYKQELALTNDVTAVQNAIDGLNTFWGADAPEAQLDAIAHTALDTSMGYRTGSSRIQLIATDNLWHEAGDGLGIGPITRANDGDSLVESDEDYWSVEQVKTVIEDNDIIPVFMVTDDVKASYQDLVSQLGRGVVVSLDSDSENIADAMKYGIAQANDVITIDTNSAGAPIGDGDDTIFPFGVAGDQVVFAGGGNDGVVLQFVPGNHYIDGGAGFDAIYGGIGQDTIDGGSSDDNLTGGDGNDTLFGSSGDDILVGGGGDDYLQGDSGNDVLTGGAGADRFGFATGTAFDISDLGVDTIQDFNASQGDKIQLSQFTFDALSSGVGTLNAADFGSVINYDNSTGFLRYQGTHFATFTGMPALNAGNFEVVNF